MKLMSIVFYFYSFYFKLDSIRTTIYSGGGGVYYGNSASNIVSRPVSISSIFFLHFCLLDCIRLFFGPQNPAPHSVLALICGMQGAYNSGDSDFIFNMHGVGICDGNCLCSKTLAVLECQEFLMDCSVIQSYVSDLYYEHVQVGYQSTFLDLCFDYLIYVAKQDIFESASTRVALLEILEFIDCRA